MKAVLLAAGLGTRLRPVTNLLAKPAVPFLNTPLLYWSIELLRSVGLDEAVVNLHHLPESILKLRSSIENAGIKLHFSHESEAPLGSGGALWFAKSSVLEMLAGAQGMDAESFLVANADEVILPVDQLALSRMRTHHEATGALATLLTMRHPLVGTKFGGVWVDEKRNVYGFGKDQALYPKAHEGLHYVGVLLLHRRIFDYLPEGESNLLYDALVRGIQAGETVNAVCEDLVWHETGNPVDFVEASGHVLELLSPSLKPTDAATLARKTVRTWAPSETRYWESATGEARMLISNLREGSIPELDLTKHLEQQKKKSAFAVVGANALILKPILNSVALPNSSVTESLTDALIP
ncbi:MAG: NDP-sugar synthase [Bdellovibrionales bacterium]|nr:NDP-sugar synthase [Bdellovibrionales bacterium]